MFVLRQSLESYRHFQRLIQEVDLKVKRMVKELPRQVDVQERPLPKAKNSRKTPWRNEPPQLREDLYRAFGIDLTQVPGLNTLTTQILLTEIGPDFSRFPTSGDFCSWLRICPNPKITGGKVISSKTRPSKNRAALALRMAAQGLHRSQSFLGNYFRRMKARLGSPKAITAAAHKLARIVYHMVTTRQEFDASIFEALERRSRDHKHLRLRAQARELGFDLVKINPEAAS